MRETSADISKVIKNKNYKNEMFTLNRHSGGVFAYRFVYAQRAHIIIIFNIFCYHSNVHWCVMVWYYSNKIYKKMEKEM